jgi:hypothetical protein
MSPALNQDRIFHLLDKKDLQSLQLVPQLIIGPSLISRPDKIKALLGNPLVDKLEFPSIRNLA